MDKARKHKGAQIKGMLSAWSILAMVAAFHFPSPLRADSFSAWQKQTTDRGCFAYTNASSVAGMESDPQPEGFVWSGECKAGAPINGEGTLYIQYRSQGSDGLWLRTIYALSGSMKNGFWDGLVRTTFYDLGDDDIWSLAKQIPLPDDLAISQYQMGCEDFTTDPTWMPRCTPGKVENPINIRPVSPAYYPVPPPIASAHGHKSVAGLTPAALPSPALTRSGATLANETSLPAVQFSQTEDKAFAEIAKILQTALSAGGTSAPKSTQQILDTVTLKLLESYSAGQSDAFGNDYNTMMAAIQQFNNQFKTKGTSGGTGEVVEMVLGFVKDSLANKKRSAAQPAIVAPLAAAPAQPYVPQPSQPSAGALAPVVASAAPQPAISYTSLRSMPFEQRWSVRDVGRGCKMILRDGELMWKESGENLNGMIRWIEWSGPCAANGLANGTGTLAIYSQDLSSQGRKISTGPVNNGIMNGRFAVEDQSNENGGWQAWSDDAGPRRYDMDYRNGCNFYDGQPEGGCTQSHALAMRDNFLAGLANITPVPQNAATPMPVPAYKPSLAQSPKVLNDLAVAVGYSYPAEAEKNGLHGTVGIEVWVSTLGRTSKCVVTQSSGHGILDDAACYAMERYGRFTPGTDDNGRQVEKTLRMKIKF